MKNTYKRLITFFVGMPILVIMGSLITRYPIVLFVFYAMATVFCILATREIAVLFACLYHWKIPSYPLCIQIAITGPLSFILYLHNIIPNELIIIVPALSLLILFLPYPLSNSDDDITKAATNIIGRTFLILYPGFFIAFIFFIANLEHGNVLLPLYIVAVYCNDGNAYLCGKFLGNNKSTLVKVSPKKTIQGFLGGVVATAIIMAAGVSLFPNVFPGFNIILSILFAIPVALAVILGDLFASALKRSVSAKQSGELIPGRGGMLDSLDSLLFAAPVFYFLYLILL